jgi:hypothetical protein
MFEIKLAIFMVAVSVALLAWFQRSRVAASVRRMRGMMTRIGRDPVAAQADPRNLAIVREMRRRCIRCPREDYCDRWLAGEVEGDNAFCPNAQTLGTLRTSSTSL